MSGKKQCKVTHAPGSSYVCWTHRHFLPWSKPPLMWSGCCCDEYGYEQHKAKEAADEIERLRNRYEILSSLITAWAVARPRLSDGSRSKTFEDACDALRKAVGR